MKRTRQVAPRRGTVESLPIELLQIILTEIPDIYTLRSAVLSGSQLYQAFIGAEKRITTPVLLRTITPALLHEALAVQVSRRHRDVHATWSTPEALTFLVRYLKGQNQSQSSFLGSSPSSPSLKKSPSYPPLFQWTLADALPLAAFHEHVQFFTANFANQVLEGPPPQLQAQGGLNQWQWDPNAGESAMATASIASTTPTRRPLSTGESHRIQRSFYRFEVYCNLFYAQKNPPLWPGHEQRSAYFSQFAPWENEQLACVHDYLANIITPAYSEVAYSDPDWLVFFVELGKGLDIGLIENQLSQGLARVRQFAKVQNPNKKHGGGSSGNNCNSSSSLSPLSPASCSCCCSPSSSPCPSTSSSSAAAAAPLTPDQSSAYCQLLAFTNPTNQFSHNLFLLEALKSLKQTPFWNNGNRHTLADFDADDEADWIKRPKFANDTDSGPEAIWRRVHQQETPRAFVYGPSQAQLRQWGYVFWDCVRLEVDWNLFNQPWAGNVSFSDFEKLQGRKREEEQAMFEFRAKLMLQSGQLSSSSSSPLSYRPRVMSLPTLGGGIRAGRVPRSGSVFVSGSGLRSGTGSGSSSGSTVTAGRRRGGVAAAAYGRTSVAGLPMVS